MAMSGRDGVPPTGCASSLPPRAVWVYVTELPPRAMAEYGHILPEPGDEAAWFAALPPEDQTHLRALAEAGSFSGLTEN